MSHSLIPLVPMAQSTDRDAEVGQIKRELEILRTRYALYRRMGRILNCFFVGVIPLLAIGALALAIKMSLIDMLRGVYFVGTLLIFGSGIVWLMSSSDVRWIDIASQTRRPYFSFIFRRSASDAELLEQQIADRERRLSELGETILGSNKLD